MGCFENQLFFLYVPPNTNYYNTGCEIPTFSLQLAMLFLSFIISLSSSYFGEKYLVSLKYYSS